MRRREIITLLGSAVAWPLAVRAQQPTMPVIGYLHSGSPAPFAHLVAVFRRALNESGYVEGRNVVYETREYAIAGGLMSYGTNLAEGYRQVGVS